jgi:3'-phosphoadenosine 5'-phosphosulfate sulfotransferase (PAPS reductase)/FAD synthetase
MQKPVLGQRQEGKKMNFIYCSCGNDSVALIQWMLENKPIEQNIVVYSNTGWAAPFWEERINQVESWVNRIGFSFIRTESEGMEALVRRKKGWPLGASPMQFCTEELKTKPARDLMLQLDPELNAKCFTGIRREESKNRGDAPAFIEQSERHGGRDLYCPLVEFNEYRRDILIERAGFVPLSHSSMECFPCVNANKKDLKMLSEYPDIIDKIDKIEKEMGYTRNGKPRVMFRPYKKKGATGIREVVNWANSERGKFDRDDEFQLSFMPCTSGFCGL